MADPALYSEGFIQALLRWRTPEAMRIYAKIKPSAYAEAVERATACDASVPTRARSVEYEPYHTLARIDETLDSLGADLAAIASTEKEARRKQARSPAPAPTPTKRKQPSPATEKTARTRATHGAASAVYDLGEAGRVAATTETPQNIVGSTWSLPNWLWPGGDGDRGRTDCQVVAYAAALQQYVVLDCDAGHHYPVAHKHIKRHGTRVE